MRFCAVLKADLMTRGECEKKVLETEANSGMEERCEAKSEVDLGALEGLVSDRGDGGGESSECGVIFDFGRGSLNTALCGGKLELSAVVELMT